MKVTLLQATPNAERLLVFTKNTRLGVGATRWSEVFDMTDTEVDKELDYIANSIPSSWEFVHYVFSIEGVSRAFTHQFVRNRTGSYAQESLRVVAKEQFGYVTPPRITEDDEKRKEYDYAMGRIQNSYDYLLASGAEIEDARGLLPTNICTNIVAQYNLRSMADLAKSRTGGRTQNEFREVFQAMVDEVLKVHPWAEKFFFGDKGRDYWTELEAEITRAVPSMMDRAPILKIIDKMRKQ